MSFKVGDLVKDNPKSEGFGIVTWSELGRTRVNFPATNQECWYKDDQLIPPTTEQLVEQLVEQLEKAGFKKAGGHYEQYANIGKYTVSIWQPENEVSIGDGENVFNIQCKDLASAVKLALTLVEVIK